jgi:hypothetical protein
MTRKLLLENKTCSRCGGSGQFSWCQSHGSTCFGCHGDGVVLTKRGKAAQVWLNAKKRKSSDEVVVGEWVLSEGIPGFSASVWIKIDTVEGEGAERKISGLSKKGERHWFGAGMVVQMFLGKVRNAELAKEALAFQETLTLAGTVRKKKAKAKAGEEVRSALRAANADAEAKNKANWERDAAEIADRTVNLPPLKGEKS